MAIDTVTQNPSVTAVLHYKVGNDIVPLSDTNKLPVNDGAATADDGVVLPLESLAKSFGYTGDNLTTITVSHNGETYIKTLTYTGDKLTATSVWVKQ